MLFVYTQLQLGGMVTITGANTIEPLTASNSVILSGNKIQGTGNLTTAGAGVVDVREPIPATVSVQELSGTLKLEAAINGAIGSSQITVKGGTLNLLPGFAGTGGIDVKGGVLATDVKGMPAYSGKVTLESTGQIRWFDAADSIGVGIGILDLKGGTIQNLLAATVSFSASIANPVTAEGNVQLVTGKHGIAFLTATTVAAASDFTLSGTGGLYYPGGSTIKSSAAKALTIDGAGFVNLLGTVNSEVRLATDNSVAHDTIGASGTTGLISLVGAKTYATLLATTNSADSILVHQGTLATDIKGPLKFTGTVTLESTGIIDWFDSADSVGLGINTLDIKGGTIRNMFAPAVNVLAATNSPVTLHGNVQIVTGKQGFAFLGATTVTGLSDITLSGPGGLQYAANSTINASSLLGVLIIDGQSFVSLLGTISSQVVLGTDNTKSTNQIAAKGTKGLITISGAKTNAVLLATTNSSNSIAVSKGTLATDKKGAPKYSGGITLEKDGIIDWLDTADLLGLGTGALDIKGGKIESLIPKTASGAPAFTHPITLEGKLTVVTGASGIVFAGPITLKAASSIAATGAGELQFAAASSITAAGGGDLTFTGSAPTRLLGTINAVMFLGDTGLPLTHCFLGGKLAGATSILILNAGTVVQLLAGTSGTASIDVAGGNFVSDEAAGAAGSPLFTGPIAVEKGATVKVYDHKDAFGLGKGKITLNRGLLQNSSGATATIANDVSISAGNATISSQGQEFQLTGKLFEFPLAQLTVMGDVTLKGSVSGSGAIRVEFDATLTVASVNSGYSGPVDVHAGTIRALVSNALGSGDINFNGGLLDTGGAHITLSNKVYIDTGTTTMQGVIGLLGQLTIQGSTTLSADGSGTVITSLGRLLGSGTIQHVNGGKFQAAGDTSSFTGTIL